MEVNIAGMARTVTAKLLKLISGDFNLRRLYSFLRERVREAQPMLFSSITKNYFELRGRD